MLLANQIKKNGLEKEVVKFIKECKKDDLNDLDIIKLLISNLEAIKQKSYILK